MNDNPRQRLLSWLGRSALNASEKLERWSEAARKEAGAFLHEAMSPEARERFSIERYDAFTWEGEVHRGLPAWENTWLERDLPAAPATLLVAGCGTGRELVPLQKRGYRIAAFDGAPRPLAVAKRNCLADVELTLATYSDLVEAAEGFRTTPLSHLFKRSFDAVLLGWGSLTHVAGEARRRRVLTACCHLTKGPVLTSFYSAEATGETSTLSVSRRLGRVLAGTDDTQGASDPPLEFSHWGGFAEYITKEEMVMHGAALGRRVAWYEDQEAPFPFVTLTEMG